MAELYLVRHGQASFGAENYDALSPSGRTQSLWLGEYFAQAKLRFDRVVIGTMQRHRQTAEGILAGMGGPQIEIAEDAGLNEYDFQALFAALGEAGLPLGLSAASSKRDFYKALQQVLQLWADDRLPGRCSRDVASIPDAGPACARRYPAVRRQARSGGEFRWPDRGNCPTGSAGAGRNRDCTQHADSQQQRLPISLQGRRNVAGQLQFGASSRTCRQA